MFHASVADKPRHARDDETHILPLSSPFPDRPTCAGDTPRPVSGNL